ncbi:hypothetical protein FB470_006879 [Amycolatopsis thermophila]|uniref:Transcription regulator HTH AraC- type ligand binding domain-containing protein n=2 Tax=Amycolatopsis thermophila TaxID=206084 RepID=A0ABU0F768_9PSEU|nr:hypothetical protein [Amycolatopsis thermophila]
MHLSERYTQMHVRIETSALRRNLERMLGRPVNRPVRFQPEMDLTAPAGVSWVRLVGLLVQDLHAPAGLSRGGGADSWADFLISGLLRAQPHNYSSALARPGVSPAVRSRVRRVVDLIETQPASDLSLTRLAEEAGVTTRPRTPRPRRAKRGHRRRDRLPLGLRSCLALRGGAYQQQYGVCPSQTLRGAARCSTARAPGGL